MSFCNSCCDFSVRRQVDDKHDYDVTKWKESRYRRCCTGDQNLNDFKKLHAVLVSSVSVNATQPCSFCFGGKKHQNRRSVMQTDDRKQLLVSKQAARCSAAEEERKFFAHMVQHLTASLLFVVQLKKSLLIHQEVKTLLWLLNIWSYWIIPITRAHRSETSQVSGIWSKFNPKHSYQQLLDIMKLSWQ